MKVNKDKPKLIFLKAEDENSDLLQQLNNERIDIMQNIIIRYAEKNLMNTKPAALKGQKAI